MTERILTRPNRLPDAFRDASGDAFGEAWEQVASLLQGVTLRIGNRTINAPQAARICQLARVVSNQNEARNLLRQEFGQSARWADLDDFLYLMDDTVAGPGAPNMSPGQQWTITYNDMQGVPSRRLLERLTDPSLDYGNELHRRELFDEAERQMARTPEGEVPPLAGIRIVYTNTTPEASGDDQVTTRLSEFVAAMFNLSALPDQRADVRREARSRDEYYELFSDLYQYYTAVHQAEAQQFEQTLRASNRNDIVWAAARRALALIGGSIHPDGHNDAIGGVVDLMVVHRTLAQLDDRIAGQGLNGSGLRSFRAQGASGSQEQRDAARQAAQRWRDDALAAVDGVNDPRIDRSAFGGDHGVLSGTRGHIRAAWVMYLAAIADSDQVPDAGRNAYFGQLRRRPDDIWGAYEAALNAVSRAMAEHISLAVLSGQGTLELEGQQEDVGGLGRAMEGVGGLLQRPLQ